MQPEKQRFGGSWTEDKLERVRKYLVAYATIMAKQRFRFAYVDAFAGTGYNARKAADEREMQLFAPMDSEVAQFLEGSARIALKVEPRFSKYIFIEKSRRRFGELCRLRDEFPERACDIELVNEDCNTYLRGFCEKRNWDAYRAVVFLDPFGMQVDWETVKAIASTKAIDLWLLFPLGIGVNRLLPRDGQISEGWQRRLDDLLGTSEWRDAFYVTSQEPSLFGTEAETRKVVDCAAIGRFFVKRLEAIFPGVANNPLPLCNSSKIPLYLLCFSAGNERGAKTAVKIAQDILRR